MNLSFGSAEVRTPVPGARSAGEEEVGNKGEQLQAVAHLPSLLPPAEGNEALLRLPWLLRHRGALGPAQARGLVGKRSPVFAVLCILGRVEGRKEAVCYLVLGAQVFRDASVPQQRSGSSFTLCSTCLRTSVFGTRTGAKGGLQGLIRSESDRG